MDLRLDPVNSTMHLTLRTVKRTLLVKSLDMGVTYWISRIYTTNTGTGLITLSFGKSREIASSRNPLRNPGVDHVAPPRTPLGYVTPC